MGRGGGSCVCLTDDIIVSEHARVPVDISGTATGHDSYDVISCLRTTASTCKLFQVDVGEGALSMA